MTWCSWILKNCQLYSKRACNLQQFFGGFLLFFFFLMAAVRLSWSESVPTNYSLLKKRIQPLWKRKFVSVQRWLCTACAHPFSVEVLHSELPGETKNIILARFRPNCFYLKITEVLWLIHIYNQAVHVKKKVKRNENWFILRAHCTNFKVSKNC